MKFIEFLKDEKASISIEMIGIFSIFSILIVLSADIGSLMVTQNKLEKISYSLASIIRERIALFDSRSINDNDAENLYNVATILAKNTLKPEFGMKLEVLTFKNEDEVKIDSYNFGNLECNPSKTIDEFKDISFYTNYNENISLYRTTLCADPKSNFVPIKNIGSSFIKPIASSITFGR